MHSTNINQSIWKNAENTYNKRAIHKHEKTCPHGAHNSPCVRIRNLQILVCGNWHANCMQTAQRMFAVLSTRTRIWCTNLLQTICGQFSSQVCTSLQTVIYSYPACPVVFLFSSRTTQQSNGLKCKIPDGWQPWSLDYNNSKKLCVKRYDILCSILK